MARIRPLSERFWESVVKLDNGCWQWLGRKDSQGYGLIPVRMKNGKYTPGRAHRVAWLLMIGEIPEDRILCHKCNYSSCVNPDHIYLGTHTTNIHDAIRNGTVNDVARLGSENREAKLTEEFVKEARERYAQGDCTITQLAIEAGVNDSTMGKAIRRRTWRHVP